MSTVQAKFGNILSTILATTVFLLFLFQKSSEAKRMCYICNTTMHGEQCLDDPANVTAPENPSPCRGYCTIKRKEFINIPGKWMIVSLERNCEDRPILDGLEAQNLYLIYYRSCKANLCNDGDGLQSLKHIPEEPDDDEDDENSGFSLHYRTTSLRIFKIYFFACVAYISSIT